MYNISVLTPESQEFLNFLSIGIRSRSMLASVAIAKAAADRVNVPASAVENIEQYFRTTAQIEVQSKVSDLNELVVLDCETVMALVPKFFAIRYYAVNPMKTVCCLKTESVIEDFFGLNKAIDPATIEALKVNPIELTKLFNGAVKFFDELAEKASY